MVAQTFVFGRITKQDKARNKFLADELEALQERWQERWQDLNKTNAFHRDKAHEWMERFKGLEDLAAETGEQHKKKIAELNTTIECQASQYVDRVEQVGQLKKQIAELQKQIVELQKEKIWLTDWLKEAKHERNEAQTKLNTAWHAHQIVKKGKQVICLTAIVEASDGPGAVAAFEAQMKEVKAKMRVRSKAPVFAKPVFPNI